MVKKRKQRFHGIILGLLIMICTSLVVACSTQSTTPEPNQQPEADKPKTGGTITVAYASEADTLDVHKSVGNDMGVTWNMGGSLVYKDPVTKEFKPNLASEFKISEDGKTYTFTIRSDVTFHDGTPLTAKSFKDTFERIKNPKTKAKLAGIVMMPMKSVSAPDDKTLILELHEPNVSILEDLGTGVTQPLSMKAIEKYGEEYGRNPVGMGPWKFESWKAGEGVTLVRNEAFKWAMPLDKNQGPPRADKLVIKTIPDKSVMLAALENGTIDVAFDVPAKDIKKYRNNPKYQVLELLRAGIPLSLYMNLTKPEFQDIQVRKAFNMLVNKQAMVQAVLMGEGEVAQSLLSPSTLGNDKSLEKYGYQYNVEEAKKLLDAAGWKVNGEGLREKDGKVFTLSFLSSARFEMQAQLLQAMLGEVGIKATIQNLEESAFSDGQMKGNFDVTMVTYSYDDPDALYQSFHSSQIGAGFNISGLKDGKLDALLTKGRATAGTEARKQVYVDAQKHLLEQAYVVPIYSDKLFVVVSSQVKGVKWTSYIPNFQDSWVQK
ncbi:ABC transporter substrate-binding protein [Brevibacillus sp. HB1.2]|uniref:ABC transporter substrate-binding protein n=1 Tax=Brevibacillus sp. HB1.2 TaxID=2738807 RepID=UPI001575A1F2|nr:ABC transporter substrate-binding protein [Brevibacillus sp. HB1.2]NTU19125.1 ABC transporter substrate-binding protein [Brevibacillus sp. HB1.2]